MPLCKRHDPCVSEGESRIGSHPSEERVVTDAQNEPLEPALATTA